MPPVPPGSATDSYTYDIILLYCSLGFVASLRKFQVEGSLDEWNPMIEMILPT